MPQRTNEKAVDFSANRKRIQHKFITKRSFIKIRADDVDLVDEIMVTLDLGSGHRFFVIPIEAYSAVAKRYGPYSNQSYVSLEVIATSVPRLFGQYEITPA